MYKLELKKKGKIIKSVDDWYNAAPPKNPSLHWKDGRSAKELAKYMTSTKGYMPKEIENLLEIARIKNLAREKSVLKINQRGNNIIYYFDEEKFNVDVVEKLMQIYRGNIKFSPSKISPYITVQIKNDFEILKECQQFLNYL